jgi:hypothetical protein
MSDGFSWIRTLYEYNRGESDRCIKACGLARYEGGVWSCPLFKFGVDKVSVATEGGLPCRLFERRDA